MVDYKKLNEVFSILNSYSLGRRYRQVASDEDSKYGGSLDQGEMAEKWSVFDIGDPDGYFLKITEQTNSYGEERGVSKIEFVKGKEKTVITYEYE